MGFRPQQPQGGYGQQPELRPGATVVSADGAWRGTVVDLTGQGADAAVRVQWDGYGLTYVTMGMLAHDNGRWIVRADGQAQGGQQAQQAQQGQAAAQQPAQGQQGGAQAAQAAYGQGAQHGGQGGYGAQAAGRDPRESRGAGDANEAARMAEAARVAAQQPQPQRPAVAQPVAGDEMTQMAAPPRPVAQPAQPQAQPQMPVQGQPARPAANPYYPQAQGASAVVGREVTEREEGRVVVPVIEEQLEAHPEWREAGSVRVNVRTEEVPQSITQDVQREEVLVERVAVGRALAEGESLAPRREGDVEIIPVIVEEVVVTTRRILAEEVRITKRVVTVPQTVEATVRRQQVEVDGGTLSDRIHDRRNDG